MNDDPLFISTPYQPAEPPTPAKGNGDEPPRRKNDDEAMPPVLDVLDVGDDDDLIPPREWLLGNAFCRQFVSGVIAPGAGGKTSLRIAQALALATERALTGEHVFLRCRVLFICLEDGMRELRRRVRAAMIYHEVKREDVKGWLFLSTPMRMKTKLACYNAKGNVVSGDLERALRAFIDEKQINLVLIDPIKKAHGVKENDNDAMDALVTIMAQLSVEKNIAFDYASHEAKASGGEPGDANRARGAGAMKDGGRLMVTMTAMSKEEADAFGVAEEERRSLCRVDSAKFNLGPPQTAMWLRLVGVKLNNGNTTYPNGDEVQAAERWTPPKMFEGATSEDLNKIIDRLGAGMSDGRKYSTHGAARDRAAWAVVKEIFPDKTEQQCRNIISTWEKNGVLQIGSYDDPKDRKEAKGILGAKRFNTERGEL